MTLILRSGRRHNWPELERRPARPRGREPGLTNNLRPGEMKGAQTQELLKEAAEIGTGSFAKEAESSTRAAVALLSPLLGVRPVPDVDCLAEQGGDSRRFGDH
jgi:hypothetical protein